ncbi:hypothetical protein ERJ75_001739200 [Trypanosoma vivax]|nr:hypothetical protein ERJ75_001739200 [Trypanosoma vivax]
MFVLRLPKDELDAHVYMYLKGASHTGAAEALKASNPKVEALSKGLGYNAFDIAGTGMDKSQGEENTRITTKKCRVGSGGSRVIISGVPSYTVAKLPSQNTSDDSDSDDEPVRRPVARQPNKVAVQNTSDDSDSDDEPVRRPVARQPNKVAVQNTSDDSDSDDEPVRRPVARQPNKVAVRIPRMTLTATTSP